MFSEISWRYYIDQYIHRFLWGLKRLLLDSIETYRQILESDADLIRKFTVCQANLGEVRVDEETTV